MQKHVNRHQTSVVAARRHPSAVPIANQLRRTMMQQNAENSSALCTACEHPNERRITIQSHIWQAMEAAILYAAAYNMRKVLPSVDAPQLGT
jgi:hypothetical protein